MQKQLSFWPIQKKTAQTPEIWQALDHEQQNQVIITLAHLIQKIVFPKDATQIKETNNEQ